MAQSAEQLFAYLFSPNRRVPQTFPKLGSIRAAQAVH